MGPNLVSVCSFLKMESHESPGERGGEAEGWRVEARGLLGQLGKLQPFWAVGTFCPRHQPGLLEGQAGVLGQAC